MKVEGKGSPRKGYRLRQRLGFKVKRRRKEGKVVKFKVKKKCVREKNV